MNSKDSDSRLAELCVNRLRDAYASKPKRDFLALIIKEIRDYKIPLYCVLEVSNDVLDMRDIETLSGIVKELKIRGDDHPLLTEMEALLLLLKNLPKDAVAALSKGLEKWNKPYLRALKIEIEQAIK